MVGNNFWIRTVKSWIERDYPNLITHGYKLTSADTPDYNCVAWAAEDDQNWWWPDTQGLHYWPPGVPREETIEAFKQAFQTLGYEVCEDHGLEEGFQKIAIYANSNKVPTHVARQLPSGKWTSKLGQDEDIEHNNLQGLTGQPGYGEIAYIMKRPITG
ncbi:MAG: hypothetical protein C4323_03740 [Mastigocladus sp. ERB_26_2]|uniref:DUF7689 domain-containing protein n=1 Tax=Fischerella muscicola CCMEE 5323 TaxID=2019572 RepID=A0A2N6JZ75_FISMU|nr:MULTISPECIES: hypothetical protein [Fischerella]MBD2434850.1 hypothetical protein [Fischerella sp. FACHB-380]PLZ86634.1 hypothetical protein CEN44_19665 [Fischerella muscicola CCMEE 5323]